MRKTVLALVIGVAALVTPFCVRDSVQASDTQRPASHVHSFKFCVRD